MIAVDPGESTGVAVLDGEVVLATMTVSEPFGPLRNVLRDFFQFEVVCEQPPPNPPHNLDVMVRVLSVVQEEVSRVAYVRPSQWKGHPAATLMESDTCRSIHEKDALRLARWYSYQRRHNVLDAPLGAVAREAGL